MSWELLNYSFAMYNSLIYCSSSSWKIQRSNARIHCHSLLKYYLKVNLCLNVSYRHSYLFCQISFYSKKTCSIFLHICDISDMLLLSLYYCCIKDPTGGILFHTNNTLLVYSHIVSHIWNQQCNTHLKEFFTHLTWIY